VNEDELLITSWMRYSKRRGWLQIIRFVSPTVGRRMVWRTLAEAESNP
jgi:hypothetical protein